MTHFQALLAVLTAILGMLVGLSHAIWRFRGWVDRQNATDERIARALENLAQTQQAQHAESRRRLENLERRRPALDLPITCLILLRMLYGARSSGS